MDKRCPIDQEALLATAVEILKTYVSDAREIELLTAASPRIEVADYDNWNGGTYTWALRLDVDPRLIAAIHDKIDTIQGSILKIGQGFFVSYENHSLGAVTFIPTLAKSTPWREEARKSLAQQGVNNQGRVRSDNVASLTHDGLLFRSQPEINLYAALKRQGVTFAPLPVVLRGGRQYCRVEPDFLLIRRGLMMVVEVDGSTFHKESPAEAQEKRRLLEDEGVRIIHVDARSCMT